LDAEYYHIEAPELLTFKQLLTWRIPDALLTEQARRNIERVNQRFE